MEKLNNAAIYEEEVHNDGEDMVTGVSSGNNNKDVS